MLKSSILRRKARPYQKTISHAAKKYGVSQNMIKAVITVETCFRSGLKGTSGEKGLMQLMPATAKRFGVKNRFSPWENIHGGTRYLRYLLRHFDGNKGYAAAAYNGGRGAVSRKSGPKFKAVRVYSRKVMNAYRKFNPLIMAKSKKRKSRKKPVKQ
ncbi:MAG: lytic transglycosylase domain-containing protein [Cocleimonas sp.]|nr:lytic transglycosylase domain-containing protein [Cocleimonas sp.]